MIGEIAHMAAYQNGGPRADRVMAPATRNEYDNLILLCQNCHAVIDGQPGTFSVERLKSIKADHELWVRASLPEHGRSATGWSALVLRGDHPVDLASVTAALSPDFVKEDLQTLQVPGEPEDWAAVDAAIAAHVAGLFAGADSFDFRLAVFPLAPVSACLALGYHLTNRPHLRLFQFHRDDRSWVWPTGKPPEPCLEVSGLETSDVTCAEVAFLFHFSAAVPDDAIASSSAATARRVHIRVQQPGTGWLQHPAQIRDVAYATRQAFERAVQLFPRATRWHIFYAGSAPAAVAAGQQINPTMCPPVQLYEFRLKENPPYRGSILLGGHQ